MRIRFRYTGIFKNTATVPKRQSAQARWTLYFLVCPMKASFTANKKGENSGGTCQMLWQT